MARAKQSRRDDAEPLGPRSRAPVGSSRSSTSKSRSSRSQQSGRVSRGHDDSDDRPAVGESTRGGRGEEDDDELAGGRTSSERSHDEPRSSAPRASPRSTRPPGRSTGRRRG